VYTRKEPLTINARRPFASALEICIANSPRWRSKGRLHILAYSSHAMMLHVQNNSGAGEGGGGGGGGISSISRGRTRPPPASRAVRNRRMIRMRQLLTEGEFFSREAPFPVLQDRSRHQVPPTVLRWCSFEASWVH